MINLHKNMGLGWDHTHNTWIRNETRYWLPYAPWYFDILIFMNVQEKFALELKEEEGKKSTCSPKMSTHG